MVTIRDRRICGTTITGFRNTNLPLILGGYISNDIGNILEDALVIRGSIESDVLSGFIPPPPPDFNPDSATLPCQYLTLRLRKNAPFFYLQNKYILVLNVITCYWHCLQC